MGNRTYDTKNRQYKALIWDYRYTEPKQFIVEVKYINPIMTITHSSIWCDKNRKTGGIQKLHKSLVLNCHLFLS